MARGNVVAVLVAGLFLASALTVSAAESMTFGSQVYGSDSAYAFNPNQQQTYSPPATPTAPPPATPSAPPTAPPPAPPTASPSAPPTAPPTASPPAPPTAPPTASPPAPPTAPPTAPPPATAPASPPPPPAVSPASGSGSCPENFTKNFDNTFKIFTDTQHVIVGASGDSAELLLDNKTAAVFGSLDMYYTGRFSAFLKLPCGNSSGTVLAFYTSSNGSKPDHDEIDIEILGNTTDKTYTLQTNIFVDGFGNREMRHDLTWFEPCQDYHEYFIQWNSAFTVIGVDDVPLRVFYNRESENKGIPYFNKGQGIWVSYWDGSKWATQGGKYKCDYEKNGPFIANIKAFHKLQGCVVPSERDVSVCLNPSTPHCWDAQTDLTPEQKASMDAHKQYCTYDYCQDYTRFQSTGFPKDCLH